MSATVGTVLTTLNALLLVASQASDAANKLGELMKQAAEEGRDITPEELGDFVEARRAAEDAWDNRN